MVLRTRALREPGWIGAVGRERKCYGRRQFGDGVHRFCRADTKSADNDGDDGHFSGLGLIGWRGIGREGLEVRCGDRDHAIAGFFQELRVDPRHNGNGAAISIRFVGRHSVLCPTANHHVLPLATGAIDDGDGPLLGGGGRWFRGRLRGVLASHHGRIGHLLICAFRPQREMDNGLTTERIVAEQGKACENHQEHAEQDGQRLHGGKW
jgi:hypothetical protein